MNVNVIVFVIVKVIVIVIVIVKVIVRVNVIVIVIVLMTLQRYDILKVHCPFLSTSVSISVNNDRQNCTFNISERINIYKFRMYEKTRSSGSSRSSRRMSVNSESQ